MSLTMDQSIRKHATTIFVLTALLAMSALAGAQNKKNSSPPPPPPPRPAAAAPAPAPARPAAAPSGNSGGGAQRPNSYSQPAVRTNTGTGGYHPPVTTTNTGGYHPPVTTTNAGSATQGHTTATPAYKPPVKTVVMPKGATVRTTPNGNTVVMRTNGKPSEIHNPQTGVTVHHNLNGGERVTVIHPDHSGTVYQKGRPSYVQHTFNAKGREMVSRTYVSHGRSYQHIYHGYPYRGMYLGVYAPRYYYSPGFYAWSIYPWGAPITYGWGFAGNPWYSYYGSYFTLDASYPTASNWLADYLISSDLQADYAAQQEAGSSDAAWSGNGGQPGLGPEVKQQIADEIKSQLALENQEGQRNAQNLDIDPGSSGIDRVMSDASAGKTHVFVVGTSLDVVDNTQSECALSEGDVLALQTAPPTDAKAADLVVLSSKGGQECQKQTTVSVALDDLQEMQNHMRESIDQGLVELQNKQGKHGMPAAPAPTSVDSQYAAIAPPPDPNASTAIQQQAQEGQTTDQNASN